MSVVWEFGSLLGFGLVLSAAAGLVLTSAISISRRYALTGYAVGFLLLGILTSLPEFFVAVQSVTGGIPQLSVGNLIGGSILLLSFVMGISSVILGKIQLNHGLSSGEIALTSFVVAFPVLLLWDGVLTRTDGALLVGAYMAHACIVRTDGAVRTGKHHRKGRRMVYDVAMLCMGFAGLAVASRMIVTVGHTMAARFGLADFVFGLVLLSFGTNLPEFALAVESILRKRQEVAFGNFLGSSATNTLILGFLGLVSPFSLAGVASLDTSLVLLGCLSIYFTAITRTRNEISRTEGIGLLLFFVVFLFLEIFGSTLW